MGVATILLLAGLRAEGRLKHGRIVEHPNRRDARHGWEELLERMRQRRSEAAEEDDGIPF